MHRYGGPGGRMGYQRKPLSADRVQNAHPAASNPSWVLPERWLTTQLHRQGHHPAEHPFSNRTLVSAKRGYAIG
jgi:hypothetical protein